MKSLAALLFALICALPASAQDAPWNWFWVQTGPSEPLIFRGGAFLTVKQNEWTFKVVPQEKTLDNFFVHARKTQNTVVARFEPPNTERGMWQVKGIHKLSPSGSNEALEQIVLADANTGQLMVFTRFKKTAPSIK